MTADTVNILRQLLFFLQRVLPEYKEIWMHILNWLANYG